MTSIWHRCLNTGLWRAAFFKVRFPTFKHLLLFLLCGWAMSVQMTYRVPSQFLFLLVPWVGLALTILSFGILANHLLAGTRVDHPIRDGFQQFQRWADYAFLGFIAYSMILFVNGRLDTSEPLEQKSEILDIVEVRDDLLRYVPYSWIDLRSWEDPSRTERIFWSQWVDNDLWPKQPVLVRVRQGFFGIHWVESLANDEEAHALRVLQVVPTAAGAWKQLVHYYQEHDRWKEARETAHKYLDLFPHDMKAAHAWAVEFYVARQWGEYRALMEPLVEARRDFNLYGHYAWFLGQTNKREDKEYAVALAKAAVAMEPDNFLGYYTLGFVLSWNGQAKGALAAFTRMESLHQVPPDAEREIGRLKKQLAR